MKNLKLVFAIIAVICVVSLACRANDSTNAPVKPYPLKTCLVCSMELGMMGGKPYEFVYQGQQIKLCSADERELFDKAPDKYMKKLADAVAKLK